MTIFEETFDFKINKVMAKNVHIDEVNKIVVLAYFNSWAHTYVHTYVRGSIAAFQELITLYSFI